MKYNVTPQEEKRNSKIILIVLLIHAIVFTLGIAHAKAQIGCSRQDIRCNDSLFTEVIDYPEFIYTRLDSSTIAIFNLSNDYCTSVTIFCDREREIYIKLMNDFNFCNTESYSSSIRYDTQNSMIFKIKKE